MPRQISVHIPVVHDQKPVLRDIINLCSDSDDPDDVPSSVKVEIKVEPSLVSRPPGRAQKAPDEIRITRSEKVTQVIELTEVPDCFPIYEQDTAFILDFSHSDRAKKETKTGKPKGLDAFLKSEVSRIERYNAVTLITINCSHTGPGLLGKGNEWQYQ
jgi:hypothetical protein